MDKNIVDISHVEAGIIKVQFESTSFKSFGYGIISQFVTRNKDISIQAKGVYSYLVAFAGNDKETYPTQSLMCHELGIKKVDTLRKYVKELEEAGVIKIVKTHRGNLKEKNIYLIADDVRSVEVWKMEYSKKLQEKESVKENKEVAPAPTDTTKQELENNFDNTIISNNTESIPQEINVNGKSTYTEKEIRDIAYNNLKDSPLFEKYPEVTKALKIEAEVKKLKTRLELGLNI